MNKDYSNIMPYDDRETSNALKRVASAPELKAISDFLYGPEHETELRNRLRGLDGVYQFQSSVMAGVIQAIIDKTSSGLSVKGLEYLQDGRKHVLVSNHRDIILDPAIIQLVLFNHHLATTEIAVGDNLIANSLIEDIFRSNRMIKVIRGGTPREKYLSSSLLSSYIRENIVSDRCSVWIAQRNGRSKDGHDVTEQGLLKMFEMSGSGDFVKDFKELSILPIAISYQYEPCDFLKARELYISRRERYVKKPGEDTVSILTGVRQDKGCIAFHFCPEITEHELSECASYEKNERFKALAGVIDGRIYDNYRLGDTNYMAYDMLEGGETCASRYTPESREHFLRRMEKGLSAVVEKDPDIDMDELTEIFLSIYANPVRSVRARQAGDRGTSCPAWGNPRR